MKSGNNMSDINMKGKKHVRLRCGCCEAYNFKEEYQDKLAEKEIRDYNKYDE